MSARIIRLYTVMELCGISRSSIYAAIQRGEFPQQVELGLRSVGWLESDIEQWIAARPKKLDVKAVQS